MATSDPRPARSRACAGRDFGPGVHLRGEGMGGGLVQGVSLSRSGWPVSEPGGTGPPAPLPCLPGPGGVALRTSLCALRWGLESGHGFDWGPTSGHVPCAPSHAALPVPSACALCCGRSGPVRVATEMAASEAPFAIVSLAETGEGRAPRDRGSCHLSPLTVEEQMQSSRCTHCPPKEGGDLVC